MKNWRIDQFPETGYLPRILVINKSDLGIPSLYENDMRTFAINNGFKLFIVSAKTGAGLTEFFDYVMLQIHKMFK